MCGGGERRGVVGHTRTPNAGPRGSRGGGGGWLEGGMGRLGHVREREP